MKTKEKALTVLNALSFPDFTVKDFKGKVFKYTHIALGTCQVDHDDWHGELERDWQQLKEINWV